MLKEPKNLKCPLTHHHRIPDPEIFFSVPSLLEDGDGGTEVPPVGGELDVVADGSEHLVGVVHIVTMVEKSLQHLRGSS